MYASVAVDQLIKIYVCFCCSGSTDQDLCMLRLQWISYSRFVYTSVTVDQLIMICMDFFIAGAQTTSTTLDFVFSMMLLYPDVQRRAQAELDAVIGRDRPPQLSDRNKYVLRSLPLATAVSHMTYCTVRASLSSCSTLIRHFPSPACVRSTVSLPGASSWRLHITRK
jgi:hypothetical protein